MRFQSNLTFKEGEIIKTHTGREVQLSIEETKNLIGIDPGTIINTPNGQALILGFGKYVKKSDSLSLSGVECFFLAYDYKEGKSKEELKVILISQSDFGISRLIELTGPEFLAEIKKFVLSDGKWDAKTIYSDNKQNLSLFKKAQNNLALSSEQESQIKEDINDQSLPYASITNSML